ncbi:MAG: tetratricopeptide repeat protein [Candidatus Omnitrophica bacterium]|nr:tetratricopeptide repeat protein [Candidatus Omnitrophota bacterium]MDD5771253.1 tetratricopeptide repeat protein [Candidatus Omnitrophota bacterium]
MNRAIIFLCLALAGCATVAKESKAPQEVVVKPQQPVVVDQKELDEIIAVFSEAIKNKPDYAGAYYNRAAAYFHKKEYDKSWQDIHKAEALGIKVDSKFLELVEKLKKASGRER